MAEATAYQFRIVLRQISPKIWRRVQLLGAQSLADLHFSIQVAMGWTDEFQHRFTIRNHRLGISRPGGLLLFGDPYEIRLEQFAFRRGERFAYEYNFYDAWDIEVRFEGSTPPDSGHQYPRCVAGAQRAPTEDCGGPEVFMERWQRDPKEVRTAHERSTVIRLAALVHECGLDPREFRTQARTILRRQPPASFDRAEVNRRLQRYTCEGHAAVSGDIQ